jgi:hypothetical protein
VLFVNALLGTESLVAPCPTTKLSGPCCGLPLLSLDIFVNGPEGRSTLLPALCDGQFECLLGFPEGENLLDFKFLNTVVQLILAN